MPRTHMTVIVSEWRKILPDSLDPQAQAMLFFHPGAATVARLDLLLERSQSYPSSV